MEADDRRGDGSGALPRLLLERGGAFGADRLHGLPQLLDMLGEPVELFGDDLVVLAVAGLDVGHLELLEDRAIGAQIAGPGIDETEIDPLGLRPQEGDVVVVRRVEGADQQHAMIEPFDGLVEVEGGVLEIAPLHMKLGAVEPLVRRREPLLIILLRHGERLRGSLGLGDVQLVAVGVE